MHAWQRQTTHAIRGHAGAPDAARWEVACEDKMRASEHMGIYEVVSETVKWTSLDQASSLRSSAAP